jgi:dTDP-4-dehydrorhamnose 3,5-epimerase
MSSSPTATLRFLDTELPGVIIVEPVVFRDPRGFFLETYHQEKYRYGGIRESFVQDNHSRSGPRILRGIHAQQRRPQGKLVRASAGAIFDVAVDIRPDSPTFARWVGLELSAENFRQLYIPPGYGHAFCVLGDGAEVQYKCSEVYDPSDEITVLWSDPEIGIDWPVDQPVVSAKDTAGLLLRDLVARG